MKAPFTGAYIITLVLYHWEFLLRLLMSKCSIENLIFEFNSTHTFWGSFSYPFLIAFLIVFIFQLANFGIEYATGSIITNRKLNEIKFSKKLVK